MMRAGWWPGDVGTARMVAVNELAAIESYWSDQAGSFDNEPDHGLSNSRVRAAWARRLEEWIPAGDVTVADLGCGTGSMSVLLGRSGAEVVGVDLSPAMIERAKSKALAAGLVAEFHVGDVSDPDLPDAAFDVVLTRHVLWNLLDPIAALARWVRLLKHGGRLVLIEGRWFDTSATRDARPALPWDGGVGATELLTVLAPMFHQVDHYPLSEDTELWAKAVADERYAVVARDPIACGP